MKLRRAVIAVASLVCLGWVALGPAHAAKYTMVISHLAPEDLNNNEMHPAMKHFEAILEDTELVLSYRMLNCEFWPTFGCYK